MTIEIPPLLYAYAEGEWDIFVQDTQNGRENEKIFDKLVYNAIIVISIIYRCS